MRRTDREVTSPEEIRDMIQRCEVCRLGFFADKAPYILPMNFGYEFGEGKLKLYFHCAKEGRKLDLLRASPSVAFEMDRPIAFLPGDTPSHATYTYECVMGEGRAFLVEEPEEKRRALNLLMEHYTGNALSGLTEKCVASTAVIRVEADVWSAKRRL